MRTLITLVVVLFCLQLWAQIENYTGSTVIDSLYAIPELDGNVTADSTGIPIMLNSSTFEIRVGDTTGWIESISTVWKPWDRFTLLR